MATPSKSPSGVPITPAGTPHHFLPYTDEGKTHITAEPSILSNGFGAKETTLIRATSAWEAANQHNHGTAHVAGAEATPRKETFAPQGSPLTNTGRGSPTVPLYNASLKPGASPQGGKVVIPQEASFPFDTKTTLI